MRTIKYFLYLFLFFSFVFQSCSVEKRRYTSGYSLQWKKNKHNSKTDDLKEEALTQTKFQSKKEEATTVSEKKTLTFKDLSAFTASLEKKKGIIVFTPDSTGCDTLIMRNDVEIKAKVIEITPTEVKYKYCDNVTGPTYVSYRYEVSYIKYANGKLDSFKDEFAPIKSAPNNNYVQGNNYVQSNNQSTISYSNNIRDDSNWMNGRAKKLSLISVIFGFISYVPFFGIPGIIIGLSSGLKALRLIKKNERELGVYKQKALIGVALAAVALLIYIVLWVYLLWKAGLLPFKI